MLDFQGSSGLLEVTEQPLARMAFDRLQALIQRRLRDPALSPEKAAQAQRISTRYLHAIFQMHGTTFGRELMFARLQEARRLLQPWRAAGPGPDQHRADRLCLRVHEPVALLGPVPGPVWRVPA